MWQRLYEELEPKGFLPIAVAFDSAGVETAGPWIRAANPTYPCLVDREHLVAELYDMLNVPIATWINEEGRMVRPPETAGTSDAFRAMDHTTYALPPEARESLRTERQAYVGALRDWAERGDASRFVLSEDEILRRLHTPGDREALAAAQFRLGEYLHECGLATLAQRHFGEAKRLRPESWAYRRQAWALEDPAKAGGPEFWAAVDALGERHYYEPVNL